MSIFKKKKEESKVEEYFGLTIAFKQDKVKYFRADKSEKYPKEWIDLIKWFTNTRTHTYSFGFKTGWFIFNREDVLSILIEEYTA